MNIGFKEDMTHEFKSDKSCLPDNAILDAVVAFSNTDGGELYLGVENDGEITGLHKKHMDITQLAAFIANKTVPSVAVRTEILDLDLPVLKITVPKRTVVVATADGKIQRRRLKADHTPENVPMYPYEIATRLSSLSLFDYSAQPVPDADVSILNPVERERLRNMIRTYRGEPTLLELDDGELDKALQMVTTFNGVTVPTFCGLLLIGRPEAIRKYMPTAEASIQILSGTDIRVNESFYLPVLAAFEKIEEYFNAANSSHELDMGLYRMTIPDYDFRAFREALVNSYSHRDYSVLGRVRVQIDDTGMTITNPGGFIEGISADNLLDAEPHGRNPVLADALKRVGLAERTGRGIDRIYEGSLLYGRLLPDYSKTTSTRVHLYIPKGPTDEAFIQMISEEQKRTGRSMPIYSLMVMDTLKKMPHSSVHEVAQTLCTDDGRIRITLDSLQKAGLAEASGTGRGRNYMLSSAYYKKIRATETYVRLKDIDSARQEEMILNMAREQKSIRRADVVRLLRVTDSQAYRLLQSLAEKGKLQLIKQGRYSKYVPV
ncbi:MAG: putative DNA binding domain-containing protein [Lachnospiraceae bacterium]|nr:putative DNA binding domain-containing protein [Lachnospiraceae bacterium]